MKFDQLGVSTIDVTGIETLTELRRTLKGKGIEVHIYIQLVKMKIIN